MALDDLTPHNLLALAIEVIADWMPYGDAQVLEFEAEPRPRRGVPARPAGIAGLPGELGLQFDDGRELDFDGCACRADQAFAAAPSASFHPYGGEPAHRHTTDRI